MSKSTEETTERLADEVERLAKALEICGKSCGGAWASGTSSQAVAARALLSELGLSR